MARLFFILGLTISVSAAAFLYRLSMSTSDIEQARQLLDHISIVDEETYYTIMMIHAGIVKNFDKLVELSKKHKDTVSELDKKIREIHSQRYERYLVAVKSIYLEKDRQLEKFKSDTAILNNAKIYIAEKLNRASLDSEHLSSLLRLSNNLMVFAETPTHKDAMIIRASVEQIETQGLSSASLEHWQRGKRHLEYYLDKKIDVLKARPLTVNWVEIKEFQELKSAILLHDARNRRTVELAFAFLVGGIILVSSLGLATLSRYLKARQALVDLNNSLEEKIRVAISDIKNSRDEAIKANAAKTSFLANVSHEVRTPLNSIIGFSARLEKRLAEKGEASTLKALKSIHANGIQLLNFFKDLLELSQYESDISRVEARSTQSVDLAKICRETIAKCSAILEKKSMKIALTEAENQIEIYCSQTKIERIMYGACHTMIHISTCDIIHCEISKNNEAATILFKANGKALDENAIVRILEPFTPNPDLSLNIENIGLGLSLAKKIIEHMNGELSLTSISKVNTLRIELPLNDELKRPLS